MELGNSSFVIAGSGGGFTPQLLGGDALRDEFPDPPVQALTTPVLTVLQYPAGYQILVQPNRLEVRREQPPRGTDEALQNAVRKLRGFWPLIQPSGVGVNFFLGKRYDAQFTEEIVLDHIVQRVYVERALDHSLKATDLALVFDAEGAQVTLKIATSGLINGSPGAVVDFNAHYGEGHNLDAVLESQGAWYERAVEWSRRLIDGD
jgi:hypothetical protein